MKKRTIILITIFSLAAVGGGGYGIYHLVKNGGDPVEVTSVANLNQGYWGSETSSSGTITSKANQEVHLESNNLIDQVYVKEGDKVKVTLRFRGRELAHPELGMKLLQQVKADFEPVAKVESEPRMEGKQMIMILAPR